MFWSTFTILAYVVCFSLLSSNLYAVGIRTARHGHNGFTVKLVIKIQTLSKMEQHQKISTTVVSGLPFITYIKK